MKVIKHINILFLLVISLGFMSCEKEKADLKNPNIDPADAGFIKVKNVDASDPYTFDLMYEDGTVITANIQLNSTESKSIEVKGGKKYKISYIQKDGYYIYPTTGNITVDVPKSKVADAVLVEIPK